ncbi:MAG: DJ-1/PfpI family protein [Bacteroidia bacterium]|nr:DJ-1/PfpI family protein [Bacteroidia bacterium]
MKKILLPIPSYGFDPSEVALPWKILSQKGFAVTFATPEGKAAVGDRLMLTGERLGIWKPVLKTRKDAVLAYQEMQRSAEFQQPISYAQAKEADFDGLILPGGHDKGVKEYLESNLLQKLVVDFFDAQKPVGAICHGVVLAARSLNPATGKSVISNYQTTSLLKSQEILAWNLTRLWLGDYYLTYPGLTVEDEVKSALSNPAQYHHGPKPLGRDCEKHLQKGFTVRDRNYISARWPGDVYNFALGFGEMMGK